MKTERYVVVDTRTTCGNSVFFWCYDHSGYTCDLRMAGVYTEEEATNICKNRDTDVKYKYSDMLKLVQHHVDSQDLYAFEKENRTHPHTYYHLEVRVQPPPDDSKTALTKKTKGKRNETAASFGSSIFCGDR